MKERIVSACVITVLFMGLAVFSYNKWVLCVFLALISAISLGEVLFTTKYIESKFLMLISILFAVSIPVSITLFPDFKSTTAITAIFVFALILFLSLIIAHKTFKLEHLSVVFIMSIIIPFFLSTIIYMRRMEFGIYYLIAVFMASWGTDTGGYVFGKMFGRNKMSPQISPKKTWEGAIGGAISTAVLLLSLAFAAQTFEGTQVNYVTLSIFAVVGSIAAILGDLSASLIKRNFGVKDFGSVIPGHGGIMDRFDSVLFVAPMLFLIINLTTKIYELTGLQCGIFPY